MAVSNPYALGSMASVFLLLSFSLYLATGVTCVNNVNAYNDIYGPESYYYPISAGLCWTDPLAGNLRPVLIVRTSISFPMDEPRYFTL